MPPILISAAKWLVTSIILPMVQKWVATYIATQRKLRELRKKKEDNQNRNYEYEQAPSATTFDNSP
jgi:hypothetical protein